MKKIFSVVLMLSLFMVGCNGKVSNDESATENTSKPTQKSDILLGDDRCITGVWEIGNVLKVEQKDDGNYAVYYEVKKQNVSYCEEDHKHDTPFTKLSDVVCVIIKSDRYGGSGPITQLAENEKCDIEKGYIPQVGDGISVTYNTYIGSPTSAEEIDGIVYLGNKDGETDYTVSVNPYDYSGLVTGEVISVTENKEAVIKVTKDRDVFKMGDEIKVCYNYVGKESYTDIFSAGIDEYNTNISIEDYIIGILDEKEKVELKVGDTISFKYGAIDAQKYTNGEEIEFTPMMVTLME
jgi:hypothetical protein